MKTNHEANLGWLAGILDGEGSVGIQKGMPKYIDLYNTDKLVINKIIRILKHANIPHKHFEREVGFEKKINISTVRISRIQHMKALSEILLPHLTCKKDKILHVLNYKPKRKTSGLPSLSINEVFNIIKKFETITPKQLANILNTNNNRTAAQLVRLKKKGLVKQKSFGVYEVIV